MKALRLFWWRKVRRYHYDLCDDCGRVTDFLVVARRRRPEFMLDPGKWELAPVSYWWAESSLWNEVAGDPGVLCPRCFTTRSEALGIVVGWTCGRAGEIEDNLCMDVEDYDHVLNTKTGERFRVVPKQPEQALTTGEMLDHMKASYARLERDYIKRGRDLREWEERFAAFAERTALKYTTLHDAAADVAVAYRNGGDMEGYIARLEDLVNEAEARVPTAFRSLARKSRTP